MSERFFESKLAVREGAEAPPSAAMPEKRESTPEDTAKQTLKCGECDAVLAVPPDAIKGEIVTCKDCSVSYEVSEIGVGGITLKKAETPNEVWGE